jgi:uncharacterized protein (TIGR03435 family)
MLRIGIEGKSFDYDIRPFQNFVTLQWMSPKQLLLPLLAGLLAAQSPAPPEKFEVASIKLIPADRARCCFSMSPLGGTFAARNISMSVLVEMAYGVDDTQISGMDRLGDELYDVSAKPENGVVLTQTRLQPMLRALLAERFTLVTHRETKDIAGYALTTAKGGPKLKPGDAAAGQTMILPGRLVAPNITIDGVISLLAHPLGKPVVDKTNLPGSFKIDLKFAAIGDTTQPSIFTAVEEQLGLKLESQKIPFEVLVIDHCGHIPTEN